MSRALALNYHTKAMDAGLFYNGNRSESPTRQVSWIAFRHTVLLLQITYSVNAVRKFLSLTLYTPAKAYIVVDFLRGIRLVRLVEVTKSWRSRVENNVGLAEFGDAWTEFYSSVDGLPIARGYDRIVYGDHGPYVERLPWESDVLIFVHPSIPKSNNFPFPFSGLFHCNPDFCSTSNALHVWIWFDIFHLLSTRSSRIINFVGQLFQCLWKSRRWASSMNTTQ